MIFRQLFDSVSGTYSYLLASRAGGEALMRELDLKLVKAVDTHLHADHVTGLGELRDRTQCITIMGDQSKADVVSMRVTDGDKITIEGLALDVMYTPGHTDDSYSYLMGDRVFTGDTLLIRGTGRTDFQNGDPRQQYDSIFNKLLRLQVKSVDDYVALMNNLNLPNPKMMDVAVPANMKVGLAQEEIARRGWALSATDALALVGNPGIAFIDLRERSEREKHGVIPGSLHAPYGELAANVAPGGLLRGLAANQRLLFYCAFGDRSAMAVQAAQDARLASACHLQGGIDAWKKASGPLER